MEQELSDHLLRHIETKRNAIQRAEFNRLAEVKRQGIKIKNSEMEPHIERMNSFKLEKEEAVNDKKQ